MFINIILLILCAGVPYYLVLEKVGKLSSKNIFILSSFLLLCAIVLSSFVESKYDSLLVSISLFSAIVSLYKATKTTNFYKFGYYLLFINAPFFMLFVAHQGHLYSLSLLVTMVGIYSIAQHYEKHYESANYHGISGTTLATPYLGTFLTLYLITVALYPPFPNSFFMFSNLIKADNSWLSYIVVIVLFFGNFVIAMRVLARTVFGKPNNHLHYVDFTSLQKVLHFTVLFVLLVLSTIGFKGAIA